MAITGTVTSAQGVLTLGSSLNDSITFTPTSGSYTVEYPIGTVAIAASSGAQTLSLANGGQLRVLCVSGSVAYSLAEVSDAWALNGPESVATRALVSTPGNIAAKRTVTGIGDSLMGYGDNIQAGGSTAGATSQSHVAWASSQLVGAPLHIIANRGVSGTLIDSGANSLMGTQLPLALADNSEILWIHSGVNHLNPSIDAGLPTAAQIIDKFRRVLDIACPQKALVIVDALTPIYAAAATPSGAAARRAEIPTINAGLRALCALYANAKFNDVYTPLALDSAGNANPDYVTRLNGIHWTTWGAYLAGLASAETLRRNVFLGAGFRIAKNVALPDFTGSGGTPVANSGVISGTLASNLTLTIAAGTGTVTASVAANKQRLVIDNSAGGVTMTVQLKLSNTATYLGTLANSDTVVAFSKIEVASQTLLRRSNPTFQVNPAGTPVNVDGLSKSTQEAADSGSQSVVLPLFPPSFGGIFATQPYAIGVALASINLAVTFEVAAGGTADVQVSGWGYNALTAL